MLSRKMPFPRVECRIWLPAFGERDAYGNQQVSYAEEPDIVTECSYAPGDRRPDTSDDIEDGRPHGDEVRMTFFLPKTLDANLRGALIQAVPSNDSTLSQLRFAVVGEPYSYMRAATPGDMSWCVVGVRFDG